jgi:hypothetical protein
VTQRIARKPREKIKPSEPCGLKTAYFTHAVLGPLDRGI